jgi:hypothetical protein
LRRAWHDHTASENVVIVFVWHAAGEAINNALHLATAFLADAIGWLIRTKAADQPKLVQQEWANGGGIYGILEIVAVSRDDIVLVVITHV